MIKRKLFLIMLLVKLFFYEKGKGNGMKVTLIGFENVDYVSRTTGKQVTGVRLHFQEQPIDMQFGQGFRVLSEFVSHRVADGVSLMVGENYDISYTRNGRVDSLRLL